MPAVRVCVQDDTDDAGPIGDPYCGLPIAGFADPVPPSCDRILSAWDNTSGGPIGSHAVEVRVCYHFTTLFNLHFSLPGGTGLDLGDVWIQRERVFVLDCPPGDVLTC